jgi:hypothetical protein
MEVEDEEPQRGEKRPRSTTTDNDPVLDRVLAWAEASPEFGAALADARRRRAVAMKEGRLERMGGVNALSLVQCRHTIGLFPKELPTLSAAVHVALVTLICLLAEDDDPDDARWHDLYPSATDTRYSSSLLGIPYGEEDEDDTDEVDSDEEDEE